MGQAAHGRTSLSVTRWVLASCWYSSEAPSPSWLPPAVAHFPTAVKEFSWRNGWFYGLSQAAAAAGQPDPCPTHTAWLKEVGTV